MPTVAEAIAQAIAHHERGETETAASIYDQLLCQLEKPDPNVIFGYGTILVAQQKFGLGITLLQTALRIYDKNPIGWSNLGVAFKFIGRDDLALNAYDRAYALDPNMPEVLAGIAGYWIGKDDPIRVEEFSRQAIALCAPGAKAFNAASMHLGMALLEQGRFEEAWPHYEYRWETPEKINDKRPYKAPRWTGEAVGTLAIHGEQGLGDEIMFMSLLRLAQRRGVGRVIVECADRLLVLFRNSFGVACYHNHASLIAAEGEPDAYIPMGSLPLLLGLPDGKPYMRRVAHGLGGKPRIGVAWRGGTYRTGGNDRSLTLSMLAPIFNEIDAKFVSVQYGDDSVDVEAIGYGLSIGPRDFDSLQARIASCDMIITVCQTALHQAGAMGVPCLVMVPRRAPWVACGETMPWYNSVRLIRQDVAGEWAAVVDKVCAVLKETYARAAA